MIIGERIKKVRQENNLTQTALAKGIGIRQNSLALLESGKRNPSDRTIIAICNYLYVNEDWLRTGIGQPYVVSGDSLGKKIEKARLCKEDMGLINAFIELPEEKRRVFRECMSALSIAGSSDNSHER